MNQPDVRQKTQRRKDSESKGQVPLALLSFKKGEAAGLAFEDPAGGFDPPSYPSHLLVFLAVVM